MSRGAVARPAVGEGDDDLVLWAHPDPADIAFLEERVMEATIAATRCDDAAELAILVRDAEGRLRAGICGWTWGGCCELQTMWVDPTLGSLGLGRALMRAAEAEARRRACTQIVLFTHDPRAAKLYTRLGYELFAALDDFPAGGAARWFRKPLAAEATEGPSS